MPITPKLRFALGALLLGIVCLHAAMFVKARWQVAEGYQDFTIFYSAARIVRKGLGYQLYDLQVQYRVQQEFASGVSIRQGALPYNHPPFEALLFLPFTWLPYLAAYIAWDVVNLLFLLVILWKLRPHVPMLRQAGIGCGLIAALAFFPVCVALLQGQDIILLLLLLTLVFDSLKRERDLAAGCWLGLGLFRFHLILPLVFVLVFRKQYRAVLGFAGVACGVVLVSAALVGWQGMWGYPHYVWHVEQAMGQRVPSDMPNLRGLLATFFSGLIAKVPLLCLTAVLSAGLLLLAAAKWTVRSAATFDLAFSLSAIVTVLVSYHAFAYDLCLVLVPVALILNYLGTHRQVDQTTRLMLLGPILILYLSPLHMILWLRYGVLSLVAPVLVVWVWGIAREILRVENSTTSGPVLAEGSP